MQFLHLPPMVVINNVPTPENQYGSAAHRCFLPFPFLTTGSSYLRAFTPSLMTSCESVSPLRAARPHLPSNVKQNGYFEHSPIHITTMPLWVQRN